MDDFFADLFDILKKSNGQICKYQAAASPIMDHWAHCIRAKRDASLGLY